MAQAPGPRYFSLIDRDTPGRCDVSPVFQDAIAFAALIEDLAAPFEDAAIELVAGIDALGFVLAAPVACRLGVGLALLRKGGKLPGPSTTATFLDYTGEQKSLSLRAGAVASGTRVLIVDEWVETGAQVGAAISLIEGQGGIVAGVAGMHLDENDRTRQTLGGRNCHFLERARPGR